MVLRRKDGEIDLRTEGRGTLRRYRSPHDDPRPRYIGPTWIGKPITPPPTEQGPEWIGKRLPYTRGYGDKAPQIIYPARTRQPGATHGGPDGRDTQ